ncbi:uncharacterized protein UV8b_07951 [Ustilaginoidea virens]|uniref:Uncharacterized protein n=1 Tax=Ustilaginoidea virens TaxID=1159556 RepID=A0A8E5HXY7_USTVR|nr:uncharacterized protein UV8b_07951 [Ustilaginoidea virens]QUC23710.1 hypothetical protein UV8b_07951 [Ustilaginoidea virens]
MSNEKGSFTQNDVSFAQILGGECSKTCYLGWQDRLLDQGRGRTVFDMVSLPKIRMARLIDVVFGAVCRGMAHLGRHVVGRRSHFPSGSRTGFVCMICRRGSFAILHVSDVEAAFAKLTSQAL